MSSKTEIANRGLSKLGEPRVSNIDTTDTKPARVMKYMWDMLLDAELAAFPWNFAVTRKQLAKDATAPAWGYSNRYRLPSDFLSLLEVRYNPDYKIETDATTGGKFILTDQGAPLYIRYIKRVTDTAEFDPLFNDAFASRLAYEGCEEITQSNTKKQLLAADYKEAISRAYANGSIQDSPVMLQESTWILAREQTTDDIDYRQ